MNKIRVGASLACIVGLAVAFQNCGPKGFTSGGNQDQASSAQAIQNASVIFTYFPAALSASRSASLDFEIQTTPSGLSLSGYEVRCALDANPAQVCKSPFSMDLLADGDHVAKVSVVNLSDGSLISSALQAFRVDGTAPNLVINQAPPAITGAAIDVIFSATDFLSGVTGFECALDAAAYASCVSPLSFTALAAGTHNLKVHAKDLAGNFSVVQNLMFTVNLDMPTVTLSAKPNPFVNTSAASFSFSGAAVSGIAGYDCHLDGAAFTACTSPVAYSGLADGVHAFEVRARGSNGVNSAPLAYSWTIDTIKPSQPSLASNVISPSKLSALNLNFSSTDLSGIMKYECLQDAAAYATCSSPKAYAALTDGTHAFKVRATDQAGNVSAEALLTVVVDTTAPVPNLTTTTLATTTSTTATFNMSATDAGSGVKALDCALDAAAYAACSSPQILSNLAVGSHNFSLRATDQAGNTAITSFNWTITGVTPTPTPGPTPPGHIWTVTVSPPAMDTPTTITLPGNYLSTISHTLCSGPGYVVNLDNTKDFIIRSTEILKAPVMIYGGRNVRIIGLQIDLATAPCASSGASGYIPGVIALRTYQVGTTFVEGAYIDIAGRSADCIDPRNFIGNFDALSKGFDEASARGQRDVVIQNTVCRGMAGDINVHGDILQTQSTFELYRNITFENVTTDSNCEGTVIEPESGYFAANNITLRRFDYQKDARYKPNPVATGGFYDGGSVQHSAKSYIYDQVFLSQNEGPYEYSPAAGGGLTTSRPACNANGIFCGAIPTGNRFASPGTGAASNQWTGINYVSPH